MAEIMLFHHAQGQTQGFLAFADLLRQTGHAVHTPDLYRGRTFGTLEAEVGYAQELGFGRLLEESVRAADGHPGELIYAGCSLGVMPAQKLAQTRPGALGALLFHACLPVTEFGEQWPADVPVQIHGMDADPFFVEDGDLDAARTLSESAAQGELFLYPGSGHLFTDRSLPDYDEAATSLLLQRVEGLLQSL